MFKDFQAASYEQEKEDYLAERTAALRRLAKRDELLLPKKSNNRFLYTNEP